MRFRLFLMVIIIVLSLFLLIDPALASNNNSNQSIKVMEGTSDKTISSVQGYWINSGPGELNNINVSSLQKAGITDVFVLTYKEDPEGTLKPFLTAFNGSGIRVHAWITCFKDSKGNFFDPDSSPDLMDYLTERITFIATNYRVDGIHLDYVRYPGTAYKHQNGTYTVTSFVKNIKNILININQKSEGSKPYIYLSAALMPELGGNAYYYGQDYTQLSKYLDLLIPMFYKGNYNQKTSWIAACTKFIVQKASGKPVIIGLQTYRSDTNPMAIPIDELYLDIATANNNGAKGYVMFKYGLTNTKYPGGPVYSTLTINQVGEASKNLNKYIKTYRKLPSSITVGPMNLTPPQFLSLLINSVIKISGGSSSAVLKNFRTPKNPINGIFGGKIYKTEYIGLAKNIKNPMDVNGVGPGYVDSSLGKIGYKSLIYMYSRIINYYYSIKALPHYIYIKKY